MVGRGRQRAHGQQRHVVAGLAVSEHRLDHPLAERVETALGAPGHGGELVEALVERLVAALHEAVGVEQQRRARREHGARLAEHSGVRGADRHRAAALEEARPVGREHERRRVACGAEGELAGLAVEHEVEHGGHDVLHPAHDQPVDPRDHLGGRGLDQAVGPERVAKLAHGGRGAQAVADHVADHERHAPVGALQHVVPVAPDRGAARARQVAGRELHALDLRQALGQQAALERLGDLVLALVDLEQPRLHRLAVVDVDRRAHVAAEAAALVARHAAVDDPAVLARVVQQAVLALPGAALAAGVVPGAERRVGVLRVHAELPARAELLLERRACEAQPALVHERHEPLLVRGPHHRRRGVGQVAEAGLGLAQGLLHGPALVDVRCGARRSPRTRRPRSAARRPRAPSGTRPRRVAQAVLVAELVPRARGLLPDPQRLLLVVRVGARRERHADVGRPAGEAQPALVHEGRRRPRRPSST